VLLTPPLSGKLVALPPEQNQFEILADRYRAGDFSLLKLTPPHLDMLNHVGPIERLSRLTNCIVVGGENVARLHSASASLRETQASILIYEPKSKAVEVWRGNWQRSKGRSRRLIVLSIRFNWGYWTATSPS
jgi:hypothetical protein